MSTSATRTCPECENPLRADGDETVCTGCGLVVDEDHLDRGPEWRPFQDDRERTGAPLTRSRHDRGLSTEIGRGGSRVTGRKRRRLKRMRRQHRRAQISTKVDRNRVYAFTEIRRLVGALSLPEQTREHACMLFKRAQEEDLLRGRSVEGFAAAGVYAACRLADLSRTRQEIADAARASVAELEVAYAAMNRELGLPTGPIDPAEYLPRFASALGVPSRIEHDAGELIDRLRETGHVGGRHPGGVAAACLYAAAEEHGHPLTQQEAAEVADVTPVTLRVTYQALDTDG